MPVYQNFLLRYYARTGEKHAREMALVTLRRDEPRAASTITLGGWLRPLLDGRRLARARIFEKMLYDNRANACGER